MGTVYKKTVENRLRTLQVNSPERLEVVAIWPGDYEAALHYWLMHCHRHGEWFHLPRALLEDASAVAELADPWEEFTRRWSWGRIWDTFEEEIPEQSYTRLCRELLGEPREELRLYLGRRDPVAGESGPKHQRSNNPSTSNRQEKGSDMRLLYIIGVPGVGKSTLMAKLVQGKRRRVRPDPFAHTVYEDGLVQLGRERADYSGTDALSMSVMPKAVALIEAGVYPRILAEGDRLASAKFFDAVKANDYQLEVVLLEVPPDVAAKRRDQRGSNQDETWLKGRISKIDNLMPYVTRTLDGMEPTDVLSEQLSGHPIFEETT